MFELSASQSAKVSGGYFEAQNGGTVRLEGVGEVICTGNRVPIMVSGTASFGGEGSVLSRVFGSMASQGEGQVTVGACIAVADLDRKAADKAGAGGSANIGEAGTDPGKASGKQ